MGTTYSKPQYNSEKNRNSLEIDGLFLSSDTIQQSSERIWRRRRGSTEVRDTVVSRPGDINTMITTGADSLDIDGMPSVCDTFELNGTLQTKIPRRKAKSTKHSSNKENTNKENINATDTSALLALKSHVEREITERVSNSTPTAKTSRASHDSQTSNNGRGEVDSVTGTCNAHSETNTETGVSNGHGATNTETGVSNSPNTPIKEETKSSIAQGSETNTCGASKRSTNKIAVKQSNKSNTSVVIKKEVVKPQTKSINESSKSNRTLPNHAEATPSYGDMKKEIFRFLTYRSYPKDNNKPYVTRLSQAGFYHTRQQDEVVCYVCGSRKSGWTSENDPFKVHVELNPNCDFLLNNSDVNVPLQTASEIESRLSKAFDDAAATGDDASSAMPDAKRQKTEAHTNATSCTETETGNSVQASNDMTSARSITGTSVQNAGNKSSGASISEESSRNNNSSTDSVSPTNATHTTNNGTGQHVMQRSSLDCRMSEHNVRDSRIVLKHGAHCHSDNVTTRSRAIPKYQNYVSLSARVASFRECTNIAVDIQRLAACGLFYTGYGDCTRCYMCGIGLRHWSIPDDPWVEHTRWSLNCVFVLEQKGQRYIDTIKQALYYRRQIDDQAIADTTPSYAGSNQTNNQPTQDNIIDNLLHQTAAQSVLEMGYDSLLIQTAIKEILHTQGREAVTAENLMEKVFALEARVEQAKVQKKKAKGPATNSAKALGSDSSQTTTPLNTKEQQIKLHCENKMLKQQSLCTVCGVMEVSIVYLPCGHLITCDACAPKIKHCQMINCGKYIRGTVRTYRS